MNGFALNVVGSFMRMVVIGDIGVVDGMMHIGDEAMFDAAHQELAARDVQVIAVSSAPAESTARYGVEAVARIGFDGLPRDAAEARLAGVLALAEDHDRLPSDDTARPVVDAIASADAVLIAGGGNMASTWPLHVYERAALTGIADRLGKRLVVSGQTLGPSLHGRDRELVAGILRSAHAVRVRESSSLALAADLGAEARLGVDDASFLGMTEEDAGADATGVLVSLSLSLGRSPRAATVERVAQLVDAAAEVVGGAVRFHAHFGPRGGTQPRGDALLHEEVRARMRTPSSAVPTGDARGAASLARSAALLVTGRYHPAVFAAPAGVPVLGLTTDEYTAVKQRGVLAHWAQDAAVPIGAAADDGIDRLHRLWLDRRRIADESRRRLPPHRADAADWWDAVAGGAAG